jgi:hypothetical protein
VSLWLPHTALVRDGLEPQQQRPRFKYGRLQHADRAAQGLHQVQTSCMPGACCP